MCGFRYLLSVPGTVLEAEVAAAVRLGCHPRGGAVERVLHAAAVDRRHIVVARRVDDIVPIVTELRANASRAERIGRAGRRGEHAAVAWAHPRLHTRCYARTPPCSTPTPASLSARGCARRSAADLGAVAGQYECGAGVSTATAARCGVPRAQFARVSRAGARTAAAKAGTARVRFVRRASRSKAGLLGGGRRGRRRTGRRRWQQQRGRRHGAAAPRACAWCITSSLGLARGARAGVHHQGSQSREAWPGSLAGAQAVAAKVHRCQHFVIKAPLRTGVPRLVVAG